MTRRKPPEARLCCRIEGEGEAQEPVMFCEIKVGKNYKPIAKRYSGKNWINLEPGWRVSGSEPGTDYNTIHIEHDPNVTAH